MRPSSLRTGTATVSTRFGVASRSRMPWSRPRTSAAASSCCSAASQAVVDSRIVVSTVTSPPPPAPLPGDGRMVTSPRVPRRSPLRPSRRSEAGQPGAPGVVPPAGHPMGLAPQQRTARRTQGRPACGASVGMAPLARRVHDVGTMRDAIDARSARAARGRGGAHATAPARRVTGTALAALVWTLSGALVLVRPIETFVGRLLFRLRRPAREELNHLTPIWLGVCRRAGADPGRYLLRVEQGETLNAFAIGGHFVAVTRAALRLPDDMLEAVIAHELGHHRELHPVATGLGWWYGLPFQAADWLLRRIRLTTAFLARVFAYLRTGAPAGGIDGLLGILAAMVVVGALVVAGVAAVLLLGVVWLPLALLVWTSRILSSALSRAAEYAADRHAVELGYGPGLT